MALFNNSKHTYYEEFSTPRDMMNKFRDIFIDQGWSLLKYETGDYSDELAVGSPTGDFCIGIKTYIKFDDSSVKGIEFQCFRTFNKERSINNQSMSIPKTNKKCKFTTQPPQSNFVIGINKGYIQVTRDHLIGCLIDDNNEARSFYVGKFLTYANQKQYALPLFAGGSTNGQSNVLVDDDTYCEPYDAANKTTSSFMFGRRITKISSTSNNFLISDYFLDFEGRWQRCGIVTTSIIDDYPSYNSNGSPQLYKNSTTFPIASFLTGETGIIDGTIKTEKIKLISNKNETTDNDSYIAGELSNLILIYDNTITNEELRTIDNEEYILFNDLFRKNSYNNNFGLRII